MEKNTPNRDLLNELGYEESIVFEAPDYDSAIVGVDSDCHVVYDYEKMAEHLMVEDGMSYEEAVDFIEYNTIRALPYQEGHPIVLHPLSVYEPLMELGEYDFDPKKEREGIVQWIRDWFEENGPGCNAVIGMSGGKDSTIAAALCVEALGKDRVIGVGLPETNQGLNEADKICEYLGIQFRVLPIGGFVDTLKGLWYEMGDEDFKWSKQTEQNFPPRMRMAMLYAVAQTFNGRVVGTCNLSENYIGYFTKYGDGASDFEPLGNLTVGEVKAIGHDMGIPSEWVEKIPDDGLPHSSPDEEKLGFTYAVLDRYIRFGECDDEKTREKIDAMHKKNAFKMEPVKFYKPTWES